MKEYLILILIIAGAFGLIGWLSHLFQRRFDLRSSPFMPRVTRRSRAVAILIAFAFGLAYFIEMSFLDQFHSIFLLVAIMALVYSFRKPQDAD